MFLLVYEIILIILIVIFDIYIFHEIWHNFKSKNPPFVPTVGKQRKVIVKEVSDFLESAKKKCKIIDPGCGTANILIQLAKKFPQHEFVGIELNGFWYKVASRRAKKISNLKIIHNDMFNESFKNADVMICFIFDRLIPKLSEKIKAEANKDVRVYSNGFKFPELELIKEFKFDRGIFRHSVFYYKK